MPKLVFPAQFERLDDIRNFVGGQARAAGFSEKAVYAIQLAADEAASNIIEHALSGRSEESFELSCEVERHRLVMTFHDRGKSFDMDKVRKPDVTADLSERKIGGLGIYLMQKLMDEVHYQTDRSGNTLILIKRKD